MEILSTIAADILAVCAGISCVAVAFTWVYKAITAARKPARAQDERLDLLESKVAEHEAALSRDLRRLELNDAGNRVTQRALLALLAHAIDGNDVAALKKSKGELQEYLIER